MPRQVGGGPGGGALSSALRDILNEAWNEAVGLKDEYLSTEHMILALASKGSGKAKKIMNGHGFIRDNILKVLKDIRGSKRADDPSCRGQVQRPGPVQQGPHEARAHEQA